MEITQQNKLSLSLSLSHTHTHTNTDRGSIDFALEGNVLTVKPLRRLQYSIQKQEGQRREHQTQYLVGQLSSCRNLKRQKLSSTLSSSCLTLLQSICLGSINCFHQLITLSIMEYRTTPPEGLSTWNVSMKNNNKNINAIASERQKISTHQKVKPQKDVSKH